MDGLRWLLLFSGLLVVVGVYLYSRRGKGEPEAASEESGSPGVDPAERVEPSLDGTDGSTDSVDTPEVSTDLQDEEPEADDTQQQKIVTLRVVAGNNGMFAGDELVLSLRGIGMRHGKFGIFHRHDGNDEDRVVFSAASLVEPGSFDLVNIKDQKIPGISLFMVLPGPVDGAQSFDLMMAAARALAQSLQAELLDESGSTLSIQRERYLREEIIQFEHGILVA